MHDLYPEYQQINLTTHSARSSLKIELNVS